MKPRKSEVHSLCLQSLKPYLKDFIFRFEIISVVSCKGVSIVMSNRLEDRQVLTEFCKLKNRSIILLVWVLQTSALLSFAWINRWWKSNALLDFPSLRISRPSFCVTCSLPFGDKMNALTLHDPKSPSWHLDESDDCSAFHLSRKATL